MLEVPVLMAAHAAFEKLPEEKKERIIAASIGEFADHGYDRASTDAITSRAGISKGLLFHYFKSKKNLYLYLVRHVVKLLTEKTLEEIGKLDTDDFFECVKAIALAKQRVGLLHERESRFIMKAFADPPSAVRNEIEAMYRERWENFLNSTFWLDFFRRKLAAGGRLRENVSPESVFRLAMAAVEDVSNRYWRMHKNGEIDLLSDLTPWIREVDACFDMIKYGVWKADLPGGPPPDTGNRGEIRD